MAWRRRFGDRAGEKVTVVEGQREISAGSTQYIGEKGGNDAPPTYQDASGAPVENKSPLGYSVGPVTITLLNITMMIGAGIYSTRTFCAPPETMNCADHAQHLLSCLGPALLVSALSTGHSVTWYVIYRLFRDAKAEQ